MQFTNFSYVLSYKCGTEGQLHPVQLAKSYKLNILANYVLITLNNKLFTKRNINKVATIKQFTRF